MHELALAEDIVRIVEQAAARAGLRRVVRLRVAVGELAVVVPEALATAFAAARQGTVVEAAELQLESEPGQARCRACGASAAIHDLLDPCPHCGGYDLQVTGGNGLRVIDMEGSDD